MKKFFNVMLPLCLTFALCSCNSNTEAVSDTSEKKDEIDSTFDDETQYEENSSKNKNHCNGDSLEAFYYGEKINLMDYAKNYINDPSLDFENISNYNGFDTSRIYYNPDFDNYKYFKLNDTYYVDFVKDEPILSFVDEAYLQKEGDFGCVGSEYAYYVHCERLDDVKAYPINNNIYNSFGISSENIPLYKSVVTLIKYDVILNEIGYSVKYDFTPLILASVELLSVNNTTNYNNLAIENAGNKSSQNKYSFIHKKGFNIFPYLVDYKAASSSYEMERFQFRLSNELLPSRSSDYCLYMNSFLTALENDYDVYKDYTKKILDSFNAYGISNTNEIETINSIDFSMDSKYFTINESENFFEFSNGRINKLALTAKENLEFDPDYPYYKYDFKKESISYNDILIKIPSKECFTGHMETSASYYKGFDKELPTTHLEDWKNNAEEAFNQGLDEIHSMSNGKLSNLSWEDVSDSLTKTYMTIENLKEYRVPPIQSYHSVNIEEGKNFAFYYVDELPSNKLYTYYINPESLQKNYSKDWGLFTIWIDSLQHYVLNDEYKDSLNVFVKYNCAFGKVEKDGSIKPIDVTYINDKSTYIAKYSLADLYNIILKNRFFKKIDV